MKQWNRLMKRNAGSRRGNSVWPNKTFESANQGNLDIQRTVKVTRQNNETGWWRENLDAEENVGDVTSEWNCRLKASHRRKKSWNYKNHSGNKMKTRKINQLLLLLHRFHRMNQKFQILLSSRRMLWVQLFSMVNYQFYYSINARCRLF